MAVLQFLEIQGVISVIIYVILVYYFFEMEYGVPSQSPFSLLKGKGGWEGTPSRKNFPAYDGQLQSKLAGILPSKFIANWFRTSPQLLIINFQFLEIFRKARYKSFMAASSFGKEPRLFVTLRRL